MSKGIVAQDGQEVKTADDYIFGDPPGDYLAEEPSGHNLDECSYEGCHEFVFRPGLCWEHFIKEEDQRQADHDAERLMCLAGVGRR